MVRKGTPILLVLALLAAPSVALGATPGAQLVGASIFGSIGHAILGAFSWTVGLASTFLLDTLAGFVKLLIPQSWIHQGLSVMEWIVAVPDYAGTVSSPGGGREFGFAGINALRELFMWLGLAVAPLALTYATSRTLVDESEPIAAPLARVLGISVVVASYGYWWQQAAALADQVTHAILTLPDVSQGLDKLMAYAVGGVALGGWQLIDLGLMAAIGIELLGLIFLKVVLILCGALLYATGPLMLGLSATRGGHALARAWASAVTVVFGLGIVWATLFAVGALLINDSSTAGPLIAGNSTFGSLMGGLMLALAGLASLWMCLKVSREAAGLLRLQLAGAFSRGMSSGSSSPAGVSSAARTTGRSISRYGARLSGATTAIGAEVAGAIPGGAVFATTGRAARRVGRRGLAGTAATVAQAGARGAAPRIEQAVSHSRVGAVAVRAARAGAAGWATPSQRAAARTTNHRSNHGAQEAGAGVRPGSDSRQNGASPKTRGGIHFTPAASTSSPQKASDTAGATRPAMRGTKGATPSSRGQGARTNAASHESTTWTGPAVRRSAGQSSKGGAQPTQSPRPSRPNPPAFQPQPFPQGRVPQPATPPTGRVSRKQRPNQGPSRPGKGQR